MGDVMMALGDFRFSIDAAAYQELKRQQQFRWASQARLLRTPAMQFVGIGEDTLELTGTIYPQYRGGLSQIKSMREHAEKGQPLLLVDGLGFVRGQWCIRQINETQSFLLANGQPRKQSFQLTLVRYGEDLSSEGR